MLKFNFSVQLFAIFFWVLSSIFSNYRNRYICFSQPGARDFFRLRALLRTRAARPPYFVVLIRTKQDRSGASREAFPKSPIPSRFHGLPVDATFLRRSLLNCCIKTWVG
jgi:hypothetical protein